VVAFVGVILREGCKIGKVEKVELVSAVVEG